MDTTNTETLLNTVDLDGIAQYILSGKCKNIAFLTGAGVSVSAGIPDFRSPGGMYDTLKPELLTATQQQRQLMKVDPTAVVSTEIFYHNQLPYLELRRPFILGLSQRKWKATISHWFVQVCEDKGILKRLYTQNIDGLDYQTDVPKDKIIGVHGTLGRVQCEACKAECDSKEFEDRVRKNIKDIYKTDAEAPAESTAIDCDSCGQPQLKPMTVLYGSSLPLAFFEHTAEDFPSGVDLLIIAGTSLTVGPANNVPRMVSSTTPRLIINKDQVGNFLGIQYGAHSVRDVHYAGECDQGFLELIVKLGWFEDLLKYKEHMADKSQEMIEQMRQKLASK